MHYKCIMSSALLFIIIISLISGTDWKVNLDINWDMENHLPLRLPHFVWQSRASTELNM